MYDYLNNCKRANPSVKIGEPSGRMTLVGHPLSMPERTGALYQSNNGVRATGTDANEREQSARTTMRKTKFWIVSPSLRQVVRAVSVNEAIGLKPIYRQIWNANDVTICTDECATTFANGLRFINGKFVEG